MEQRKDRNILKEKKSLKVSHFKKIALFEIKLIWLTFSKMLIYTKNPSQINNKFYPHYLTEKKKL